MADQREKAAQETVEKSCRGEEGNKHSAGKSKGPAFIFEDRRKKEVAKKESDQI